MCYTYLKFRKALEAQGISRDSLPHKSFWQPYGTYYALIMCFIMTFVGGYTVFLPGFWDVPTFLFSYTMIGVFPIMFFGWKLLHKTKWVKPEEADLKKDLDEIEEYERNYVEMPPRYVFQIFVQDLLLTRWQKLGRQIFQQDVLMSCHGQCVMPR